MRNWYPPENNSGWAMISLQGGSSGVEEGGGKERDVTTKHWQMPDSRWGGELCSCWTHICPRAAGQLPQPRVEYVSWRQPIKDSNSLSVLFRDREGQTRPQATGGGCWRPPAAGWGRALSVVLKCRGWTLSSVPRPEVAPGCVGRTGMEPG